MVYTHCLLHTLLGFYGKSHPEILILAQTMQESSWQFDWKKKGEGVTRSKPLKSWSLDTLSGQDLVSVQVVLTTTQRHGLEL